MKFLSVLFFYFGNVLSKVLGWKLMTLIKRLGNIVYSGFMTAKFKSVAGHPFIEYPMILIGGQYISIGKNFFTRGRLRIEAYDRFGAQQFSPRIEMGNNVCFNYDCHVGCTDKVIIGDNVLIGSRVLIIDHAHGGFTAEDLKLAPGERPLVSKGPVIIEDNVWIGEGVAILPNVTIGKNCIIAANAVVSKSIPPNSLAAGIPAIVIKSI